MKIGKNCLLLKLMIYIIASILASTSITILFKLFGKYNVDVFQAIVVNYFIAIAMGWWMTGDFPISSQVVHAPTFPFALIMGVFFITSFTAQGKSIEYFGITITAIMQRMSLLMTVIFAFIYFDESISLSKVIGLICAFLSIILVNYKPKNENTNSIKGSLLFWFIPFYVFFSSGIIEIILQYVELRVAGASADPEFITTIFAVAGMIGVTIFVGGLISGRMKLSLNNVIGGVILGVPNYLSIYFIMKALGAGYEGSYFFPVNNVAIIAIVTLIAFIFFKEKLSKINIFGVILALIAIALISMIHF